MSSEELLGGKKRNCYKEKARESVFQGRRENIQALLSELVSRAGAKLLPLLQHPDGALMAAAVCVCVCVGAEALNLEQLVGGRQADTSAAV